MYRSAPVGAWSPRPDVHVAPTTQPLQRTLLVAATAPLVPEGLFTEFERIDAKTTAEAIVLLKRERPIALLLDGDSPGFDIVEICRAAATIELTSVLVTLSAAEQAPSILKAGCHAILLKPFAPNLLAARLGRMTRERIYQLRLRSVRASTASGVSGANRVWAHVSCPRCAEPNAVSFEFASHRRTWFACLACDQVWIDKV
jgi:CheY-like chemotaxis protein